MVGQLPMFIEQIMNTPSHHRMHHRPPGNCNYGKNLSFLFFIMKFVRMYVCMYIRTYERISNDYLSHNAIMYV